MKNLAACAGFLFYFLNRCTGSPSPSCGPRPVKLFILHFNNLVNRWTSALPKANDTKLSHSSVIFHKFIRNHKKRVLTQNSTVSLKKRNLESMPKPKQTVGSGSIQATADVVSVRWLHRPFMVRRSLASQDRKPLSRSDLCWQEAGCL